MQRLVAWAVFLLTACAPAGSHHEAMVVSPNTTPPAAAASPATSPATSPAPLRSGPTPQPSASASLLFAALESSAAGSPWPDTVLIAGLDGKTRVSTKFTPITPPPMGCLGSALPPAAYVAAHKVYFADRSGVVRSLSVQGQIQTVATFPTSSQQMLSFAVDPDGSRLMASVLTVPRLLYTQATCPRTGPYYAGDLTLDVFSAHAGGSPQLLYHETVPLSQPSLQYPCTLDFVGWDRVGPLAVSPACLGPGGGPVHYFGGSVVEVDAATGRVLNPLADFDSCRVQAVAPSGDFVCDPPTAGADAIVRRPDGSEIWRFAARSGNGYYYSFLSPDEQHVLSDGDAVLGRDGGSIDLAAGGFLYGWLDASTVIGAGPNGDLGYVALNAPATLVDVGFPGSFVGTVST
ncbi:MAG TPA: hypothetical protein VLK30_12445 [Candidatus Limnocylindrales bacterium]|nr:hypothetical protein [Candidatus Limnocylindrales bacterium]